MKCSEKNCKGEGKWAPKICVPATGWPIDTHQPLTSIMTIELCDDHKASYTIGNFINDRCPEIKEVFRILTRGKCPPDFDRAFLSWVNVSTAEYKKFKEMARGQD